MTNILVMYSNEPPSSGHIMRLADMAGVENVEVANSEQDAIRLAPEANIFLGHRYLWQSIPFADNLKWVQSTAAGVDALLVEELYNKKPLLSRLPIFAKEVAWHALALAMTAARDTSLVGHYVDGHRPVPLDMPRNVTILGMGQIGMELADLLKGLGCHVIGINRTKSDHVTRSCDEYVPFQDMHQVLERTDWLFVTLSLNPETESIVDEAFLNALKPGAVLVNIGRGRLVQYSALIDKLRSGHLARVAVDVIDGISDAERHCLFAMPEFIYTPKTAGLFPARQARLEDFVEGQVKRYLTGQLPEHCFPYNLINA